MDLKEKVLIAALDVFRKKGVVFTMDDVAREIGISKKTIYTVYKDKEALYMEMTNFLFNLIKEGEEKIVKDTSLNVVEKIKKVLTVMPEGYVDLDYENFAYLEKKYPKIYMEIRNRLESGWELTLELIQQGMDEGCIRNVNLHIFKAIMESTYEKFLDVKALERKNIRYKDAVEQTVDILVDGIVINKQEE